MANLKQLFEHAEKILSVAKEKSHDELMFTYKGVLYPSILCSEEMFQALDAFEFRPDDLLMVSYPKCGTNWTQHILYDMVYTISNQEPPGEIPMLEFGTPQKLERLSNLPSPRVLITHLHRDYLPEQVFTKKLKTLVVFRNPKDNAVSLFHFHLGNPLLPKYNSWDEFFTVFMSGEVNFGSYFDHAIAWNKHIEDENVLIIMFEDMKKDLIAAISQIADFFSIHLTKEQIELIATNGSFKTMKEKSTETHGPMGKFIFRKGEVGDWKNYFSEAQSLEMDAKFEACLAGTKIGEKMKYNVYCKA
ncbi:sulfotransferase 6B1-like [Ambystoma mexicanum]|uniref:sulfotransferase 6B1-like n=1 Tax=Ambystoma mexicanum TaxID=8296 RepID=UPI0037E7A489